MSRTVAIGGGLLLAGLASCTLLVPGKDSVTITASDPYAVIFVDGIRVGEGVAKPMLQRDTEHWVVARHGDRVGTAKIDRRLSAAGILDLIGIPLFGVTMYTFGRPGSWQLDPKELYVELVPVRVRPDGTWSKADANGRRAAGR